MGVILTSSPTLPGTWTAITSGTGAIDVQNIPTGYKFMRLLVYTAVDGSSHVDVKFNNDGGNNYFYTCSNNTVHGESAAIIRLFNGTQTVLLDITILNVATSIKLVKADIVQHQGGASQDNAYLAGGTWTNNTDEINRITLTGTPVYWTLYGANV